MNKKCVICQNSDMEVAFIEFNIEILRCKNCGHIYSSYRVNQDYDGYFETKIASKDHFWWNEAHQKMYQDFFDRFIINKKGKLLDAGCGLGYFVKKASSFSDWQVFGYEISKPAVEFARNELGLKNVFCGRVEESNFSEEFFDFITLWDVIEHIPNPKPLLLYLFSILKKEGILFIHTPNVQIQLPKAKIKKILKGMNPKEHYLEAKDHINIYSVKTIRRILNDNGFKEINFIHLHPIQSIAGSKNVILKVAKNFWFYFSKILYNITFGKINFDNLFIIAKK